MANRAAADLFAANVLPGIRDIQNSGATSLRAVDTKFLLTLLDAGIDVVFCDLPQVPPGAMGRFFVTQMVAVAELEAGLTGERTRAALAQAKKRGVRLGNPRLSGAAKGAMANRAAADLFAANVLPVIRDIQNSGATSLRAVAAALAARQSRALRARAVRGSR